MKQLRYKLSKWWSKITFVYRPFVVMWNEYAWNGIRFRVAHFETQAQAVRFCRRISHNPNYVGIVRAYRIDGRNA